MARQKTHPFRTHSPLLADQRLDPPPTNPTTASTSTASASSPPLPAALLLDDDERASCIPSPRRRKKPESPKMADPFEVRMRFTSQLQHLNASVTSAQKAAHYALKYRDMDEDLHSCILEQLERNNMNNRANIFYFLEALCDLASREGHPEFIRMMERDILKIIDLVAPDDGSGAANVKVVRKVLAGLASKSYLQPQTVVELEECIKDRDQGATAQTEEEGDVVMSNGGTPSGRGVRLDKRQIEQRIEEDRERHKRLRESIWAVGAAEDEEFNKMVEETTEIEPDDYMEAQEEIEERKQAAKFHAML